jgi:hypothetical protein
MKKRTAVEFVIDEIRAQIKEHGRVDAITISALRQMGKGIEKNQIIEAVENGGIMISGLDYYTSTYGS